jgi:hypothetical protein
VTQGMSIARRVNVLDIFSCQHFESLNIHTAFFRYLYIERFPDIHILAPRDDHIYVPKGSRAPWHVHVEHKSNARHIKWTNVLACARSDFERHKKNLVLLQNDRVVSRVHLRIFLVEAATLQACPALHHRVVDDLIVRFQVRVSERALNLRKAERDRGVDDPGVAVVEHGNHGRWVTPDVLQEVKVALRKEAGKALGDLVGDERTAGLTNDVGGNPPGEDVEVLCAARVEVRGAETARLKFKQHLIAAAAVGAVPEAQAFGVTTIHVALLAAVTDAGRLGLSNVEHEVGVSKLILLQAERRSAVKDAARSRHGWHGRDDGRSHGGNGSGGRVNGAQGEGSDSDERLADHGGG